MVRGELAGIRKYLLDKYPMGVYLVEETIPLCGYFAYGCNESPAACCVHLICRPETGQCVEPGRFWKIRIPVPELGRENYGRQKGRKLERKRHGMLSLSPEGNAPPEKRKKTITEPFKPHERTVKRYQPDAGREPLLR